MQGFLEVIDIIYSFLYTVYTTLGTPALSKSGTGITLKI
jgi:hypothetical protein